MEIRVSHAPWASVPITSSGTMSPESTVEDGANANAPKASNPVPGRRTASRTVASWRSSSHHTRADVNRVPPRTR